MTQAETVISLVYRIGPGQASEAPVGCEWRMPADSAWWQRDRFEDAFDTGSNGLPLRAMNLNLGVDATAPAEMLDRALFAAPKLGLAVITLEAGPAADVDAADALFALLTGRRFAIEASGCRVALEVGAAPDWICPVAARELVDAINSPGVGVCLADGLGTEQHTRWQQTLGWRMVCVRARDIVDRQAGGAEWLLVPVE